MKKERLEAILKEKEANPAAYKKDGYLYFEELLKHVECHDKKAEPAKEVPKVVKPVVMSPVKAKKKNKWQS